MTPNTFNYINNPSQHSLAMLKEELAFEGRGHPDNTVRNAIVKMEKQLKMRQPKREKEALFDW